MLKSCLSKMPCGLSAEWWQRHRAAVNAISRVGPSVIRPRQMCLGIAETLLSSHI